MQINRFVGLLEGLVTDVISSVFFSALQPVPNDSSDLHGRTLIEFQLIRMSAPTTFAIAFHGPSDAFQIPWICCHAAMLAKWLARANRLANHPASIKDI